MSDHEAIMKKYSYTNSPLQQYTKEKIYLKVTSDFDSTGYMQPRSITWTDGRIFPIEQIRDFRPAASLEQGRIGDCYTVKIHGREIHLFFERTDPLFHSRVGRWYVEQIVPVKKDVP